MSPNATIEACEPARPGGFSAGGGERGQGTGVDLPGDDDPPVRSRPSRLIRRARWRRLPRSVQSLSRSTTNGNIDAVPPSRSKIGNDRRNQPQRQRGQHGSNEIAQNITGEFQAAQSTMEGVAVNRVPLMNSPGWGCNSKLVAQFKHWRS